MRISRENAQSAETRPKKCVGFRGKKSVLGLKTTHEPRDRWPGMGLKGDFDTDICEFSSQNRGMS